MDLDHDGEGINRRSLVRAKPFQFSVFPRNLPLDCIVRIFLLVKHSHSSEFAQCRKSGSRIRKLIACCFESVKALDELSKYHHLDNGDGGKLPLFSQKALRQAITDSLNNRGSTVFDFSAVFLGSLTCQNDLQLLKLPKKDTAAISESVGVSKARQNGSKTKTPFLTANLPVEEEPNMVESVVSERLQFTFGTICYEYCPKNATVTCMRYRCNVDYTEDTRKRLNSGDLIKIEDAANHTLRQHKVCLYLVKFSSQMRYASQSYLGVYLQTDFDLSYEYYKYSVVDWKSRNQRLKCTVVDGRSKEYLHAIIPLRLLEDKDSGFLRDEYIFTVEFEVYFTWNGL